MNFKCYIPFANDIDLLNKSINSIIPQINEFSSYEGKRISILNDSEKDISGLIENVDAVEILELPYRMKCNHAIQGNWMIKDALGTNQPFCMSTHTDAELLPGAMKNLIDKYEEVKGTKWGAIFSAHWGHIYCMTNPRFFEEENVWFDPFLFPFYYMDNHMWRIMALRGYTNYTTDSPVPLVKHVSSHYLKQDPIFRRKNDLAFNFHGGIYSAVWGGLPGQERWEDPYANGTLPRKE